MVLWCILGVRADQQNNNTVSELLLAGDDVSSVESLATLFQRVQQAVQESVSTYVTEFCRADSEGTNRRNGLTSDAFAAPT